jgi:hypothetical protein
MIEHFALNVFEHPTEPAETALSGSGATTPFLRTFGRLVVAASTQQREEGQPLLLPPELTAELLPQMAAFEAAHAALTAGDLPRVVRRISLGLLGLAQARATALAAPMADHTLVAHMDTSVARLRAQLARLPAPFGGPEALAALDALGDNDVADLNLVLLDPHHHDNNNDNNADA